MNYRYAKKLQSGDDVTIKDTKETVNVHTVDDSTPKVIVIEVFTSNGWRKLTHKEIL